MNPNNELLQAAKAAADQLMAIGVSEKSHDIAVDLRTAIARAEASASQPAPDDEREKAIESWRTDARLALPLYTHDGKHTLREHHLIPRAVALMRSAPLPAPAVPSDAEIEAFLPPFDHCVSARDVAQQLGFELKDGYLSPKDQAIVEHAAACIEDLMRRAPAAPAVPSEDEIEAWRSDFESILLERIGYVQREGQDKRLPEEVYGVLGRGVGLMRRAAAPAEPRASAGLVERSVKEREELVREAGDIFASGDGWQTRGECEEWMRNALGLPPAPFPDEVCEGSYEDDPCGPVEYHDEESTPLCARCWNDLTAESERRAAGGAS